MKIKGKKIEGRNQEICVIPRPEGNIVFTAQSVLNMDDFNKLCPPPIPPKKIIKGGQKVDDIENPTFKKKMEAYGKKRIAYLIIKSLEATEGLEWEKVSLADSSTWEGYEQELKDAGFSEFEIGRIVDAVMTANCLNEARLEEARKDFLLSRQQQQAEDQSIQEDEQVSTVSGELVNA